MNTKLNEIISTKSLISACTIINKNIDLKNELIYITNFLPENSRIGCRIFCIKNNITEIPKCKYCGKELEVISAAPWFKNTCGSNGCIKKYKEEKCLIKRGVKWPSQDINVKEKLKQTNINKYGCEYSIASEKVKNKIKQTNNIKYGVDNVFQSNIIKEKIKQTNNIKYGVDNYTQTNEFKNLWNDKNWKTNTLNNRKKSCLKKYGTDEYVKTDEFKEKYKRICLEKYGATNIGSSNYYKLILNQILEKGYYTKKKNNSFSKSKLEDKLYKILCEKYGTDNIIRQYYSKLYPFACDFYIKSINTYIELQGYWTHGKHPFDETNPDDLKTLQLWKDKSMEVNFKGKNKDLYKAAINTWTIMDPLKRKIAKENNLNYIEIWNNDFMELSKLDIL